MRRPMRRKDRLVTNKEWMDAVLNEAETLELGMVGPDGWPYVVPLGFGYDGKSIYFHGAAQGKKVDILAANPKACFQIYLDDELERSEAGSDFDVKYRSLTGFGTITVLTDLDEKNAALAVLMDHYDGPHEPLGENHTRVWVARLDIEHMTGKYYGGRE